MCYKAEHIKHTIVGSTTLAPFEYPNRHNTLAGYIHWMICKHMGLQVTDKYYGLVPEMVISVNGTTIMRDIWVITYWTILANKPDKSWYFVDRASQYNLFFFISKLIHCFSVYVQYLLSFLNGRTTKTSAEGENTIGCMYNLDLLMMGLWGPKHVEEREEQILYVDGKTVYQVGNKKIKKNLIKYCMIKKRRLAYWTI